MFVPIIATLISGVYSQNAIKSARAGNPYDNLIKPLKSNAAGALAALEPRFALVHGCAPISAFSSERAIPWELPTSDVDYSSHCKLTTSSQTYGKIGVHVTPAGVAKVVLIYAWYTLAEKIATKERIFKWDYVMVFPKVVNGNTQNIPESVWTPTNGFTAAFDTDETGQHVIIKQVRESDQRFPTLITGYGPVDSIAEGVAFPLIDLDNTGDWTAASQAALDSSSCPLSKTFAAKQWI